MVVWKFGWWNRKWIKEISIIVRIYGEKWLYIVVSSSIYSIFCTHIERNFYVKISFILLLFLKLYILPKSFNIIPYLKNNYFDSWFQLIQDTVFLSKIVPFWYCRRPGTISQMAANLYWAWRLDGPRRSEAYCVES